MPDDTHVNLKTTEKLDKYHDSYSAVMEFYCYCSSKIIGAFGFISHNLLLRLRKVGFDNGMIQLLCLK